MSPSADEMLKTIRTLSDAEKLEIVDALLRDLDRPDPEVDRVWAEEAERRYRKFNEGDLKTVEYEQVMKRHRGQ